MREYVMRALCLLGALMVLLIPVLILWLWKDEYIESGTAIGIACVCFFPVMLFGMIGPHR